MKSIEELNLVKDELVNVYIKAQKIKTIITDVDGVLTDASLYIDALGNEPLGRFSVYDGVGVKLLDVAGIRLIVISARDSMCTKERCRLLGIEHVFTGVVNKALLLSQLVAKYELQWDEVAYIGDDYVDISAMLLVGLKIAPCTALPRVKDIADYVTKTPSGQGILREVCELILFFQDKLEGVIESVYLKAQV